MRRYSSPYVLLRRYSQSLFTDAIRSIRGEARETFRLSSIRSSLRVEWFVIGANKKRLKRRIETSERRSVGKIDRDRAAIG